MVRLRFAGPAGHPGRWPFLACDYLPTTSNWCLLHAITRKQTSCWSWLRTTKSQQNYFASDSPKGWTIWKQQRKQQQASENYWVINSGTLGIGFLRSPISTCSSSPGKGKLIEQKAVYISNDRPKWVNDFTRSFPLSAHSPNWCSNKRHHHQGWMGRLNASGFLNGLPNGSLMDDCTYRTSIQQERSSARLTSSASAWRRNCAC